ncbi:WD domain, G-beta repeat [Aureliella helgolandensis]|uniref:WD domain, G-beta repeat n=2 Tax=Aureliella helgolandensis TaxID=2527968 RepID=A0A518G8L1_9BACT|nr:WD domain, G-beta repeat [Aureliella helgolandensis]
MYRTFLALALALTSLNLTNLPRVSAEEKGENAADGPWITSVAWSAEGQLAATQSQGLLLRPAQVVKATAAAPAELEVVGEAETSLWSLLPISDSQYLASDYKGGVYLFGDGEPQRFTSESRWIRALAASPTDGEVLAGTEDGKLLVLSIADKSQSRSVEVGGAAIFDIAVSQSGEQIAVALGDGSVKVLSWPKLDVLKDMQAGHDALWSVAFVQEDTRLVTCGAGRTLGLWDLAQGKQLLSIASTSDWGSSLVALPESNLVVAGGLDGVLTVVDHHTMHSVSRESRLESGIWSMALSADGQTLAVGTRKHGMQLVPVAPWIEAGKLAAESAAQEHPPAP